MNRAGILLGLLLFASACNKDPNDMALKDVMPRSGALQVEQPVTITGSFRNDLGYTVWFGSKRSARVSVRDPSTLVAITPVGKTAGPVDILIIADNGVTYKITGGYEYLASGGGNVIEQMGAGPQRRQGGGSLAY